MEYGVENAGHEGQEEEPAAADQWQGDRAECFDRGRAVDHMQTDNGQHENPDGAYHHATERNDLKENGPGRIAVGAKRRQEPSVRPTQDEKKDVDDDAVDGQADRNEDRG